MRAFLRTFLIILSVLSLLLGAFLGGYWYHAQQMQTQNFPVLDEAYSILKEHGLKDTPPDPALEYGMIRGMLQAYDEPHTTFADPPQTELESNTLAGKFGGIGVQLGKDEQGNWVLFPFPDSPAIQAGIQEGDRLLAVGELAIAPETTSEVIQSAIRGLVGESVILKVGRPPGFDPLEISIKRAEIPLPSVSWHLAPGESRLGVIGVNIIAASTSAEIESAVKDLQQRGATHFALDLRDDPGGLLDAGIEIARLFLKDGEILKQQYRGRDVETYQVEHAGSLADIPLTVLINHGSASASEIIAGALQAHQRAPLIGAASFGKDTIQLVFELHDKSSLHVTAAHWWIPGLDAPLEGTGLQPDIPVEDAGDASSADLVLQAAIQYFFGVQ